MKGCDHILSTCYSKAWGGKKILQTFLQSETQKQNHGTTVFTSTLFFFIIFFRDVVDLKKKAPLHRASDVQLSVESSSALRVEPSRAQQHEAASQLR